MRPRSPHGEPSSAARIRLSADDQPRVTKPRLRPTPQRTGTLASAWSFVIREVSGAGPIGEHLLAQPGVEVNRQAIAENRLVGGDMARGQRQRGRAALLFDRQLIEVRASDDTCGGCGHDC
jgi:hypothetical protein